MKIRKLVNGLWSVDISILIQMIILFTGETIFWIKGLNSLKLKWIYFLQTHISSLHKTLWWTGVVCNIVMFLSTVWTLILTAPIHCIASIGEQVIQCYIFPNLMKKQTHLHLWWPEDVYIFRNVQSKANYSFYRKHLDKSKCSLSTQTLAWVQHSSFIARFESLLRFKSVSCLWCSVGLHFCV